MIYDLLLTLTFKVSLLLGVSLKIGLSLIVSILLRDNREVLTSGYNISVRLTDMELIAIVSSDCLLHPNVIVDVSLTIATLVGNSLTLRLHSVLRQLVGGILRYRRSERIAGTHLLIHGKVNRRRTFRTIGSLEYLRIRSSKYRYLLAITLDISYILTLSLYSGLS